MHLICGSAVCTETSRRTKAEGPEKHLSSQNTQPTGKPNKHPTHCFQCLYKHWYSRKPLDGAKHTTNSVNTAVAIIAALFRLSEEDDDVAECRTPNLKRSADSGSSEAAAE